MKNTAIILFSLFIFYMFGRYTAALDTERHCKELTVRFQGQKDSIRLETFYAIAPKLPIVGGPYKVIKQNGPILIVRTVKGEVWINETPTGLIALPESEFDYDPFKDEWVVTKPGN